MDNQLNQTTKNAIELSIRLGALILLLFYCFQIIAPFILPTLWAAIIAIAVFPLHHSLQKKLGGRKKAAAAIITIGLLSIILIPAAIFISSVTDSLVSFKDQIERGVIQLDKPSPFIKTWPIIGDKLFELLNNLSGHLTEFIQKHQAQILTAAKLILLAIVGTGLSFLQIIVSIIIAGILLAIKGTEETSAAIFEKVVGDRATEFMKLTSSTIRTVVKGVLGVALIQSFLAGLGFFLVGVPQAAILTLIALVLAIVQLGPGLIIIPVIIFLYSDGSSITAVLWTIYFIGVMLSDNILKPFLLGKGAHVPMLVIFIGVTGGFLLSGFIGLFAGPIILSVGYKLFLVWMKDRNIEEATNE
jgi:predicted PurR-regulated permease PerM